MFKALKNFYGLLISIGDNCQSFLLLVIRLFWGFSFFWTGFGKLQDIGPFEEALTSLGFPFPLINAYAAASVECIGGACLFLGLGSRLAAIPLAVTMIVAFATAHLAAILADPTDPLIVLQQAPFTFLFASILIFVFGPGKASLDYFLEKIFKKDESYKS